MSSKPCEDPLTHAWRIQQEAATLGFDWPDVNGPLAKVREEATEIEEAVAAGRPAQAAEELGDLLFAVVNLARFLAADPRESLAGACARFSGRFRMVQEEMARQGRDMQTCSLEELDAVWDQVKVVARQRGKEGG